MRHHSSHHEQRPVLLRALHCGIQRHRECQQRPLLTHAPSSKQIRPRHPCLHLPPIQRGLYTDMPVCKSATESACLRGRQSTGERLVAGAFFSETLLLSTRGLLLGLKQARDSKYKLATRTAVRLQLCENARLVLSASDSLVRNSILQVTVTFTPPSANSKEDFHGESRALTVPCFSAFGSTLLFCSQMCIAALCTVRQSVSQRGLRSTSHSHLFTH